MNGLFLFIYSCIKKCIPVELTRYAVLASEEFFPVVDVEHDVVTTQHLRTMGVRFTVDDEGEDIELICFDALGKATRDTPDPNGDVDFDFRKLPDRALADDRVGHHYERALPSTLPQSKEIVGV